YICREICMNAGGKMNIIWVGIVALTINIPLGKWRNRYKKFTVLWWLLIHASIPLIITLRIWLATPRIYIPLFIALAVLGQSAKSLSLQPLSYLKVWAVILLWYK
ncbi:hypothetical protein EZS27_031750, partial [termite gut metagenome]